MLTDVYQGRGQLDRSVMQELSKAPVSEFTRRKIKGAVENPSTCFKVFGSTTFVFSPDTVSKGLLGAAWNDQTCVDSVA